MKKQKLYILVSVVVIAVLSGVFFLVSKMPSKDDKDKNSSSKAVQLVDVNIDDIKNVNVKNTSGEYNIKIESTDDTSTYSIDKLDESQKLSKEKVDGILNTFSKFKAEEEVEEGSQDLSKYGLDNPKVSVSITFSDDTQKTFYLGNDAPLNAGVYLKVNDENNVYLIKKLAANLFLNSAGSYVDTSPSSSEVESSNDQENQENKDDQNPQEDLEDLEDLEGQEDKENPEE